MVYCRGHWYHTPGAGNRSSAEAMMDEPLQIGRHFPSESWCSSCRFEVPDPLPCECSICSSKIKNLLKEEFK